MRSQALSTLRGGINRLRVKGLASASTLYDLINAYITNDGGVVGREGTIRAATLDATTVGLMAQNGIFNVFSTTLVSVPVGYTDNVLVNPVNPALTLTKIWFAKPFLGFPYVVAQFSDGSIFHYWLQNNGSWAANTVYMTGAIVIPDTPNGLAYQAQRQAAPNSNWSANSSIALNDKVEPTEYTGYYYKAVAVVGDNPHTSGTEPVWPTTTGATLQEFGDFDQSQSDAGTTGQVVSNSAAPLGSNITDRYGDSEEIAGQTGAVASAIPTVTAANVVTTWAAGTVYAPGAVVKPSTGQGAFINAIPNGDFEAGDDGNWTLGTGWTIGTTLPYQGSFAAEYAHTGAGNNECTMFDFGTVTVGQSVTASCYAEGDSDGAIYLKLKWYDDTDTHISDTMGSTHSGGGGTNPGAYSLITVTGSAPAGATRVRVSILFTTGSSSARAGRADLVVWNLETAAAVSNFLFEAVQTGSATSGSTEPSWPTTEGNTVLDGGVTWEAIGTSIITWQAIPIMESGSSQPVFPTVIGGTVNDPSSYADLNGVVENTSMSWVAIDRHISDAKNPNTNVVLIGAAHVFAGSNDIVPFSAAVDPTDWSSANNAGYLPTGLNIYGDNPVAVLALYRSNLMAFNAGGYQMYQIDPDPANMDLLDAQPTGSRYTRAAQSVANDLLFLTEVGVRNISTTGAQANMQVGNLGQPVDKLVVAQIKAATYDPISIYYPGRGQYWLIFGPLAFVLTINGTGQKTWSRYTFPDAITDWTINGKTLYLRSAGNLVWQIDPDILVDDFGTTANGIAVLGTITGGALYKNGTYTAVPLTGGTGTGATADITVAGGAVTAVSLDTPGTGYVAADVLSATAASLGGTGSGFAVPVTNTGVWFTGLMQWPYLDLSSFGTNKLLFGVDTVGDGTCTIQVGFNQQDKTTFNDNAGFSSSLNVTPPYTLTMDDSLPDQPIGIAANAPSYTVILAFRGNQKWAWEASNIYLTDQTGGGATQ